MSAHSSRSEGEVDFSMSSENDESLYSQKSEADMNAFLGRLCQVLGISTESETIFDDILDSVQCLTSESENAFLKKEIEMKDRRIADLEVLFQKSQTLTRSMKHDIDESASFSQNLQKEIAEKDDELENLADTVDRFLTACECSSCDDALAKIKCMQDELYKLRKLQDIDACDDIETMAKQRQLDVQDLRDLIKHQAEVTHNALESLERKMESKQDDSLSMGLFRNLENTNHILEQRVQQLTAEREKQIQLPTFRPSEYRSDGLGPSLWMAHKRELLSLERQMTQMSRKLEATTRNCQFLAHENMRLHGHGECNKYVSGTLI